VQKNDRKLLNKRGKIDIQGSKGPSFLVRKKLTFFPPELLLKVNIFMAACAMICKEVVGLMYNIYRTLRDFIVTD